MPSQASLDTLEADCVQVTRTWAQAKSELFNRPKLINRTVMSSNVLSHFEAQSPEPWKVQALSNFMTKSPRSFRGTNP